MSVNSRPSESPTLIVGAGPTGLTAALELARRGHPVRIIEKRTNRPPLSKALAINPRTLDLLEDAGVTSRLLEAGWPAREIQIHAPGTTTRIPVSRNGHRFGFMLVLAQHRTEAILEQRLLEEGVRVERGCELTDLRIEGPRAVASIRAEGGSSETIKPPLIFAVDGSQSAARRCLGLDFPGDALTPDWQLADVDLDSPLDPDKVHLLINNHGPLFVLRIEDRLWRLISPRFDPREVIPENWRIRSTAWASAFTVSHQLIESFHRGPVFFGGDAAHLHSPFGARGMNLGIEDAVFFAECFAAGRLEDYAPERFRKDGSVVSMVRRLSRFVASTNPAATRVRSRILPWILKIPAIQRTMLKRLTGLD